jgi:phosphoenolpyruvate carboxykinase (diphosphate)
MRVFEREAPYLIEHGYFEKVEDIEFEGRKVLASRLGYRITASFVDHFLGRIFEVPGAVFPEELLRPEKQGLAPFVAGVEAIVEAQRLVALNYFEDGSINVACPPIKALLHIMAYGSYDGMTEKDKAFRALFTPESVMTSDWYKARLVAKHERDKCLWARHKKALDQLLAAGVDRNEAKWRTSLCAVTKQLERVNNSAYLHELTGTIGLEPSIFE